MNKKIIYFLVGVLLLTTTFISVAENENNVIHPFNHPVVTARHDKYPVMIDPPAIFDPYNASPKPDVVEVPDEFSWRNYNGQDWTSPIKKQHCGDCWLFAAIGALESIINIREGYARLDPDLSEQYVLSCLPDAGGCQGGSAEKAFLYMMEDSPKGNYHNGALPEYCFPYVGIDADGCDYSGCDHDPVPCSDKCENWEDYLVPILDFDYWYPDGSSVDIDRIKTQVMQEGPVVTHMYANDDFQEWASKHHDPEEYYPYTGHVHTINHCVVIVGWKDDPSIGNGGYWICRNSWGTSTGYGGFFNIEYGSLNIDSFGIVSVNYDPESYDWPPVADIGGSYCGDVEQEITFDASQSFDPEGDIVLYNWTFGDGTTGTGVNPTHVYQERGIFNVTLTVTDETGKHDMDETAALVDLWITGDSWTYDISDINITLDKDGQTSSIQGSIENLVLTVTDDTGEYYQLDFNGKMRGEFQYSYSMGVISGSLAKTTRIDGSMFLRQSDLGVEEINAHIKGILTLSPGASPLLIPVPFNVDIKTKFDTILKFLDFPLDTNKTWDLPSTSVSIDGQIKSVMLNVLNFINKITGQELLPPEIAGFLPIINIRDVLDKFGVGDPITIPSIPSKCISEKEVTVEGGTFNTYEIHVPRLMSYYYAPAVSNIVKISVEMEELSTPYGKLTFIIHGELTSTNHNK